MIKIKSDNAPLAAAVESHIIEGQSEAEFRVPAGEGKVLAFLADRGTILDRRYLDGVVELRVRMSRADLARAGRMVDRLGSTSSGE